jgi:hypothetical protein
MSTAVETFLEVWTRDPSLAYDVGPRLACGEVDALAELLTELGRPDAAEAWIEGHAVEDDEGDRHYRGP